MILADMQLQVGRQLGPYRLLEVLGSGATASVFRAVADGSQREIALKVVHAVDDQRRLFETVVNEAMASSAVRHPNVVTCLSYGSDGEYLYIVMELAEGGDSSRLVRSQGRLDETRALALAADCARGLEAIHAAGLIHRDIKPLNIMLDAEGRARIGDLGLVFPVAVADQGKALMGTPAFMSPEQAGGGKLDARTDIFSLGATLYFWVTGQAPFSAANSRDLLRQVAGGIVADPRSIVPTLSPGFAALIATAMHPQREHRYADASAFGQAIAQVQAGQSLPDPERPKQPAPVAAAGQAAPVPRNRPSWPLLAGVVSATAVVALALGLGLRGPSASGSAHASTGAAGAYEQHAVTWVGDRLLPFTESGAVRYARAGRQALFGGGAALVCSDGSAVLSPLVAAGSFSIELVIQVDDLAQSGPARILACGLNHKVANLMIGQSGTRIEVRCRTTATNTDGTRPHLATAEGCLTTGTHHLVFTRRGERHTLWLDGIKVAEEMVPGSLVAWDPSLPIAIGDEARGGFPWSGSIERLVFHAIPLDEAGLVHRAATWNAVEAP